MAIAQAYPLGTPKTNDLIVGTSIPAVNTNEDPKTVNFSVGDIVNLAVTGSGTLNTIPLWTPDGTKLGDSNINQGANGNITVGVNLTVVDDLSVEGGIDSGNGITVNGSDDSVFNGPVTFNDTISIYGDTTFEGEVDFQTSVIANGVAGTAGQVLSSTGNNVQWVDAAQTTEITITDAELRTIGDTPVEILPSVSGYIYQILGATAQAINTGGLGDEYDWQGQDGFISWRNTVLTNAHRVEIPNNQLPSGGVGVSDSLYVVTPIAGTSRVNSPLIIGVTNNTNPIINIGESPSATWKITLTYRLIQL
mgnify:CR=1 FL=1